MPRFKGFVGVLAATAGSVWAQNVPPATPVITEPQVGRIINPADLHMETDPFSDANPGDTHVCTDWEVWTAGMTERVWVTACIGGVERLHTHLGDGVFQGSLAGRTEFFPDTDYVFRVRHRDSSGVGATEWSAWSSRPFRTGPLTQIFELEAQDVLTSPTPTLRDLTGAAMNLPGGAVPARVVVSGHDGELLLELRGPAVGNGLVVTNPTELHEHGAVRVIIAAGSSPLLFAEANLRFTDDSGQLRTVYLPQVSLEAGESVYLWVSENGSTYAGEAGQIVPDFSVLLRGATVPWTVAPGYRIEVVASGFQLPVNLAFVPNPGPNPSDPLYYVNELYGTIKVVSRDGTISNYATGLLNFNPTGDFPGSGEQGLVGLCIDPATGDLFVTLLYSATPGVEAAPHYPRIVRMHSNDGGRTMATQTVLRDMVGETMGQSHQISNISIGPDGNLYVHLGDGFDAGSAQNLSSYRGKVLRMTLNGFALASNPYYNGGTINSRDYAYAIGVRNPFGGAWRTSDGAHYMVENGPSVDRFSRLVAGRNYLWDGSDASMSNFALYTWNPATAPVNIDFIQSSTFGGSGFPESKFDHAFVTQSGATWATGPQNNAKCITEWEIDGNGVRVAGPTIFAQYNGSGKASAAAIAAGPDGLYFSDFYTDDAFDNPIAPGSNILRIRYIGEADCNANGVADAEDISTGASADCNTNFIPDECDLGSGRSADCNNNGVLDECDVASTVTYNFDASSAPFQLNGSATRVGGRIRLTPAQAVTQGAMVTAPFSNDPMTRFDVAFDFQIGNGSGADGLSFMALNSATIGQGVTFGEEGMGVGSIGVQFDTYDNGGEGENTIEVISNGVTIGRYTPTFDLEDNLVHRAFITFAFNRMTVQVTNGAGAVETAFPGIPINNYTPFVARYAFGARSGGLHNEHWIDNVSFSVAGPNDANANGVPDECECIADFDHDLDTDSDDILQFFAAWDSGDPIGDVDGDLDTDSDDVVEFFARWEAGC